MNRRLIALVVALSAGSSSCWFKKPRPRVFSPPPPRPRPPLPTQVQEVTGVPEVVADNAAPEANVLAELGMSAPRFPRLPAPPEPKRPVVATPKPAPLPTSTPEPPPQQPRIGQIFTAEQIREYNRNLEDSLERVRRALGNLAGKKLNPDQTEVVNRIRTFQNQAEQAREQDLATAVSLARRADLLAQDLIGRLP
ncbi:MAG: hypothetical protein ABL967_12755 [Bryobacteraceae bacterium]